MNPIHIEENVCQDEESLDDLLASLQDDSYEFDNWRTVVPEDSAYFKTFEEEVWGRRPSSLVSIGSLDTFHVRVDFHGDDLMVDGFMKTDGAWRVQKIGKITVNKLIDDDGGKRAVPYQGDLKGVMEKLTEIFLDRTQTPGQNAIGVMRLPTPFPTS